jgi:peptidoglycan/xylan/chitin deacetylase (PgdA/CDA1 family)
MRLFRPLPLLKLLYPEAIFRIRTDNKKLCLTFDDGPHPDSTPRIIDILEAQNLKAIFFCSGQAAEEYPWLMALITSKGHIVGNHGFQHLNGWITNTQVYIRNVTKGANFTSPYLFRPPYGRIRPSQFSELKNKYRIVFWDLMANDFDERMSSEKILRVLKKKIRPGSVIVLHDKPSSAVFSVLGEFIKYAEDQGYEFYLLE